MCRATGMVISSRGRHNASVTCIASHRARPRALSRMDARESGRLAAPAPELPVSAREFLDAPGVAVAVARRLVVLLREPRIGRRRLVLGRAGHRGGLVVALELAPEAADDGLGVGQATTDLVLRG